MARFPADVKHGVIAALCGSSPGRAHRTVAGPAVQVQWHDPTAHFCRPAPQAAAAAAAGMVQSQHPTEGQHALLVSKMKSLYTNINTKSAQPAKEQSMNLHTI